MDPVAFDPRSPISSAVWRLTSADGLRWHRWDNDVAVFDPATGQTHVLDILAAETLRNLTLAPASATQLIERVAHAVDMEPGATLAELVATLIERFAALGLIDTDPA